jgi:hypothetical protein
MTYRDDASVHFSHQLVCIFWNRLACHKQILNSMKKLFFTIFLVLSVFPSLYVLDLAFGPRFWARAWSVLVRKQQPPLCLFLRAAQISARRFTSDVFQPPLCLFLRAAQISARGKEYRFTSDVFRFAVRHLGPWIRFYHRVIWPPVRSGDFSRLRVERHSFPVSFLL